MKTRETNFRPRISVCLLFCGLIVFWSFQVFGQQWTEEQKEIWEVVVADWELFKQGDLVGLMADRHNNATIWSSTILSYDKPVAYELEPLAIGIIGNVANVFYEYKWNGNVLSERGRTMDTWIKQDNKWLLIASFSASCDKLPLCK